MPAYFRMFALLTAACCAMAVKAADEASLEPAAAKPPKHKPAQAKTPYGQDASLYTLTLDEEFDRLNRRLWNDHVWYERPNPVINYTVEDGMLKIWPQVDASGKFFNRTIDTDGKWEQTYGYFEIEARLPRGKGTWPAFWLFGHPGERRPEIDIMEAYAGGAPPWGRKDAEGIYRPTAYGVTIWTDKGKRAGYRQYDVGSDLSTRFHKYAVKWEPHKITFYFDGKEVYAKSVSMPDPLYIILDLWFGSDSGEPDGESTPQGKDNAFEVKYVRAWQFKDTERRQSDPYPGVTPDYTPRDPYPGVTK